MRNVKSRQSRGLEGKFIENELDSVSCLPFSSELV